jgi:hypothetical protein
MMDLAHWEHRLQSSILDVKDDLGDWIKPSHLSQALRLEIYQNAYLLRLAEALRTNFPSLYAILEEDDFGRMILGYLRQHAPTAFSIRWFGEDLAAYLESFPPPGHGVYLAEIARFEWAIRHTVDAPDQSVVTIDELMALDPEEWLTLSLRLHPSVSLLNFEWNSVAIWQSHSAQNEDPPESMRSQPSSWLVYRDSEGRAAWRSLLPLEYAGLSALSIAATFPDLCDALAERASFEHDLPQTAASFLKGWVGEGILTRC